MKRAFLTCSLVPVVAIAIAVCGVRATSQTFNSVSIHTLNERDPAGGWVQIKNLISQPRPISSGGARLASNGFSIAGAAVFSPLGDTAGTAIEQAGSVVVQVISPGEDFASGTDGPVLVVTLNIPTTVTPGSVFPIGINIGSIFQSSTGAEIFGEPKPGILTIAGTVSVSGVYPGGGTWPPGTVISVIGSGFQPTTKISARMKIGPAIYVSPTEIEFTLQEAATLDAQPIQVENQDGSKVLYYLYLRGKPIQAPSRVLLQNTDPMFPTQTLLSATVGPLPALQSFQFTALAIQNPGANPATVTLQLQRTGETNTIILPSGARVMDEISVLLGGASVLPGDIVQMSSTSGVSVFGIQGDESLNTVTPFAPAF
jgi:hypothetical protein